MRFLLALVVMLGTVYSVELNSHSQMQQRVNSEIDSDESAAWHDVRILSAVYGKAEVTQAVQKKFNKGMRTFNAKNAEWGDSWPGYRKTLVIAYLDGFEVHTKICEEHRNITLP